MNVLTRISQLARGRVARESGFDSSFVDQIVRVGVHPFILVRISSDGDDPKQFVHCLTQNEAGSFVNGLSQLAHFSSSKLIRAVERALQLDIYEAAALFYSWAQGEDDNVVESIHLGDSRTVKIKTFWWYPAFGFGSGGDKLAPSEKQKLLLGAFEAYDKTTGNDALRFAIMEAMALAVARINGKAGKYADAAEIVDRGIARAPGSLLLRTARHALSLKLAGEALHPRFEKFIGDDNGYLKDFVCSVPFDRLDIGPDGTVLLCCGHWLPTSVGNFMNQSVDEVLNSKKALDIRKSVTDGSYKYCNHIDCRAMVTGNLTKVENATAIVRRSMESGDFRIDHPAEVMFAFDQTCNLSCPSCRTERITEKTSQSLAKARAVEEKFSPLLSKARILHINPAGELFASKPSRKILEMISDEATPDIRLAIISNGTLFTEQEWNKYPGIHNRIHSIRISIDAATKVTFEKLRRLGNYDTFVKNMRFLRHLRMTVIPQLKFSFTYQIDNFREMPAFMDFCEEMHADFAIFERLQNITFTSDEYLEKAVHRPSHRLYGQFIETINDQKMSDTRCWHDFDYPGFVGRRSND